jgi:hypothetical protein
MKPPRYYFKNYYFAGFFLNAADDTILKTNVMRLASCMSIPNLGPCFLWYSLLILPTLWVEDGDHGRHGLLKGY